MNNVFKKYQGKVLEDIQAMTSTNLRVILSAD